MWEGPILLPKVGRQAGIMDVYWLEQSKADLPAQNDWLSASDMARLDRMRYEKRRDDWRLGRWTAKLAVAAYLDLPTGLHALAEIEVRPAPSGAPEVFLANHPAELTISLSHRAATAVCAIAASGAALGCDLEVVEPRSDAFVADYFTPEEQELIARAHPADRFQLVALLWSAKESTLKALRTGLRLDTRCVAVDPANALPLRSQGPGRNEEGQCAEDPAPTFQPSCGPGWQPLQVRCHAGQVFQGWWQHQHNFLRTLVAAPSPSPPIPLISEAVPELMPQPPRVPPTPGAAPAV
jgi:4'-phosphopantetheinyl transferase